MALNKFIKKIKHIQVLARALGLLVTLIQNRRKRRHGFLTAAAAAAHSDFPRDRTDRDVCQRSSLKRFHRIVVVRKYTWLTRDSW
jgi:hypothetical protein